MPDPSAYTRRQFLGTGLAMVSTAASVPLFLDHAARALAAASPGQIRTKDRPGVPDDRVLVVVQLTGGNDGLNTVVPFGMREYYKARPRLAVEEKTVLRLGGVDGVGLHPSLAPLAEMLGEGAATIVQGVGYPNPNRSHFTSMDIWHTADPAAASGGGRGTGWIGRALDELRRAQDGRIEPTACVCLTRELPLAAQGREVKPIAFEKPELFRWSARELHPSLGEAYDRLNRAGVIGPAAAPEIGEGASGGHPAGGGDPAAFLMRTALDAQVSGDRIRAAVAAGSKTTFPYGPLAQQLRGVAAMIRAGLPTRVYYVTHGSFDTHANQPGRHAKLLEEFAAGVKAFYGELAAIGQRSRVLTLAFSEFGRRVAQNASNGTDHGTAAPLFLFGDMVRPGVLGDHPSLATADLDAGDLVHAVDFRCVYASILDGWMKLDSRAVLGEAFRPAVVLDPKKV